MLGRHVAIYEASGDTLREKRRRRRDGFALIMEINSL